MKPTLMLLICALAASLFAQQPANEEGRASFHAVDIFVDSKGTPLAAYQVVISFTNANVKIVGIEGGEHPAFHEPPVYDPKAIQHERVIIAAFNTGPESTLPTGRTRVATIHVQTTGDKSLHCTLKVQTAAKSDGTKIAIEAISEERKTE